MESNTWFSIYRQFTLCFQREYYVDVTWINIYRNALTQFRMGVSQINTHKYRCTKLPEEVNCPFCEKILRVKSISFCINCPLYRNLRTRYLVNYNSLMSPKPKLLYSDITKAKLVSFTHIGHVFCLSSMGCRVL